jgi:hypothetical protein
MHIGQKVECIDASPTGTGTPFPYALGSIHKVSELSSCGCCIGVDYDDVVFFRSRWRPVTDISLFTALLKAAKILTDA